MRVFSIKNSIKGGSILFVSILCYCCTSETNHSNTLFRKISPSHSQVHFQNTITEDLYFNFLNYSYIYNGGGIAVGDINNDGLEDLYFTSNQNSNKLYLNHGDFKFEDIAISSQTQDTLGWTTGVTMVDINNDGWLDIYVCKSGALKTPDLRKNKLYINQKNNTFKEQASAYGLDHFGFSVQAYFFDYDRDGDLDMYLVNHRGDFRNNTTLDQRFQHIKEPYNSDQLFRNDQGHFTNVTEEAGVTNKAWGLSASIGDFNDDGYFDVYVANDFLEPDFLYINQGDGTFKNEILSYFNHISANSMGSDFADINNDLKPDLIVLDMMAEDHIRSKQNMATMSTQNFNAVVAAGYHHQYMSNMLQLNNSNQSFSEIGQLAGVSKTDWSWAPLLADFDNDGYNDLFVTNGIVNDLSNQDFRNQMRTNIQNRKKVSLEQAIGMMPSTQLKNYAFKNNADLTFKNVSQSWGLDTKVNSCGAAYADLDNDGDLDLVVNNQDEAAAIYQNNTSHNDLTFTFKGSPYNRAGIGAKVAVYAGDLQQSKTRFRSRGYQSSMGDKLHFGLHTYAKADSVRVYWPDGKQQLLTDIPANNHILLDYKNANSVAAPMITKKGLFKTIDLASLGVHYTQKENFFNDFDLQLLLPQKQSEVSSPLAVADVNQDGRDDFFVGNAQGEKAALYIQQEGGKFLSTNETLWFAERAYEDTNAKFLDADADGDLDLWVTSGGYEVQNNSPLLQDRLYINDGTGVFLKSENLPSILKNTKAIASSDYDHDGDVDVFVGSRVAHGKYPTAAPSILLENSKGLFAEVTQDKLSEIETLKMVNDAVFTDYDKDGDQDLLVVGEWMPVTIFENRDNTFLKKTLPELEALSGWYQTIREGDFNNDGYPDYVVGNWGANNKFHPSTKKPLHIYADDFDHNTHFDVVLSKVSKSGELLPVRGKQCSSEQTPYLNQKIKSYKEFAALNIADIYGERSIANAIHYQVTNLKSLVMINDGTGGFKIDFLPVEAQFSPTLGIEILDVNADGNLDIFGVGNIFEAEVETIRYDASQNYVLLGNGDGGFTTLDDVSFLNKSEAKTIKKIKIDDHICVIIMYKNSQLEVLQLN